LVGDCFQGNVLGRFGSNPTVLATRLGYR